MGEVSRRCPSRCPSRGRYDSLHSSAIRSISETTLDPLGASHPLTAANGDNQAMPDGSPNMLLSPMLVVSSGAPCYTPSVRLRQSGHGFRAALWMLFADDRGAPTLFAARHKGGHGLCRLHYFLA